MAFPTTRTFVLSIMGRRRTEDVLQIAVEETMEAGRINRRRRGSRLSKVE
jgi:hypothetical protein